MRATHTANAWRGCAKVHAGCTHCYAETLANRFPAIFGKWGTERQGGVRVVANLPKLFSQVRKWDRQSYDKQCWYSTYTMHDPEKPRVFWNDVSDFFEPWQGHVHDRNGNAVRRCECGNPIFWPDFRCGCGGKERFATMADVRRMVFNVVDETPNLTHLFLTKRPGNVRRMWPSADVFDRDSEHKAFWPNVWLLYSASDQATLDAGLPDLLTCRDLVPVLGLSLEPLVGPVRIPAGVDWVIVGGESGPNARPCQIDWIRSIVEQCRETGVPCFVKQDFGPKPGLQGRIPDELWAVKELPHGAV
jgi:protein gp37